MNADFAAPYESVSGCEIVDQLRTISATRAPSLGTGESEVSGPSLQTAHGVADPDVAEFINELLGILVRKSEELTRERARSTGLEGDRIELQAKIGYLEQQLAEVRKRENDLHIAICVAVERMNIGESVEAHTILRKTLVAYADAAIDAARSEGKP